MDKASVSRAVARLTTLKYIQTLPHSEDGRVQTLRLTAPGWTAYRKIAPYSMARQRFLLSPLTVAEAKSLYGMLERIEAQAERYYAPEGPATKPAPGKKPRKPGPIRLK